MVGAPIGLAAATRKRSAARRSNLSAAAGTASKARISKAERMRIMSFLVDWSIRLGRHHGRHLEIAVERVAPMNAPGEVRVGDARLVDGTHEREPLTAAAGCVERRKCTGKLSQREL